MMMDHLKRKLQFEMRTVKHLVADDVNTDGNANRLR